VSQAGAPTVMHADEVRVDEDTVRRLVAGQFPQLAARPVRAVVASGTVNAIFRIGDDLAARFPLAREEPAQARRKLEREAAASRDLGVASTVPCPRPVALGAPGLGYPMPWSIQTWLTGEDATVEDPAGSREFAHDLAALIVGLRNADTHGRRFRGQGRGGRLTDHDEWVDSCLRQSEGLLDVNRLRSMWSELRELPKTDLDVMTHGDLTPPNVLVEKGRLTGILDGGGFAPADPALDLVSAWHLLNHQQRAVLRQDLGCSENQWRRGMAWALQQALGLVWYYAVTNPVMSQWGARTLDRLLNVDER
jgi:aminoglycoside phosphotransferase (APT) family kinase protein